MANRAKVFIGSSVEGLSIAYAIQQNLSHDIEATVWSQGIFELSTSTIESLTETLEQMDFGIFVFSADDISKIRAVEHKTVRDNIIFEFGLYIGRLGRKRTFIVMPDISDLHIPTDLYGINPGKYETNRSDGNIQAATGPVCNQIRLQINKLGILFQNITISTPLAIENKQNEKENTVSDNWLVFFNEKNYESALSILETEILKPDVSSSKLKDLHVWKAYCNYKMDANSGINDLIRLINEHDSDDHYYRGVTQVLLWENEFEQATRYIESGLKKFPEEDILKVRKAFYLNSIGKTEEAIEYTKIQSFNKISVQFVLALLYDRNDEKENAYEQFVEAYRLKPDSEETLEEGLYRLGKIAFDVNKPKVALYIFSKLIKTNPSNSNNYVYYGNALYYLGLYDKAYTIYEKANKMVNESEEWIMSNIGNTLKTVGLYTEARKYFDKGISLNKDSDFIYSRISELLISQKNDEESLKKYISEGHEELINEEVTISFETDLPF